MKDFYDEFLEDEVIDGIFDETMSYEELEELYFELDGEKAPENTLEDWLNEEKLTFEEGVEVMNRESGRLTALAEGFSVSLEDSFQVCKRISEEERYEVKLQEFLQIFLPEQGILRKKSAEIEEKDRLTDYAMAREERERTKYSLSLMESLQQNWLALKPELLKQEQQGILTSNITLEELEKVYYEAFSDVKTGEILKYNLEVLLVDLNQWSGVRKIAPLYIYQVVVNHRSRLQKNKDISIDLKALWAYKEYGIDCDNGKNFKNNRKYIHFFRKLCDLFRKDSMVNISLSLWGFMLLSNLVDFQRAELEDKLQAVCPYLDELVENSFFSCYSNREEEAVLLKETGYSLEKVSYFQTVPRYSDALEKISSYMNKNSLLLLEKITEENAEPMKVICGEILMNSDLKKGERPKKQRELDLFLCAINLGILDIVDYFAKEYVVLGLLNMFRKEFSEYELDME